MIEIRLEGPGKNALSTKVQQGLIDQLVEAGGRPILLTGSGDAFSAGLDLKEVATLDGEAMLAYLRRFERMVSALYLYQGPTVAAVNGHAIAGGCILTLCCDYRVIAANPKLKIGLNEVAIGVRFPPRTLAIVKHRLPPKVITEVLLGAGLYDPASALRRGLVDEVADDVVEVARTRLAALAVHPAEAYAATKRDLRGTESDLCSEDEEERRLRAALDAWTAPSLRQRIAALLSR